MEEGRWGEGERGRLAKEARFLKILELSQKHTRGGLNEEGQQDTVLKIGG